MCKQWYGYHCLFLKKIFIMCAQRLMREIETLGLFEHVRESDLKVDCWKKIPCRSGESNLCQQCAGPDTQPTELHPRCLFHFVVVDLVVQLLRISPLGKFRPFYLWKACCHRTALPSVQIFYSFSETL